MRTIVLSANAMRELEELASRDLKLVRKVIELISETSKTPFTGRGKPEALKHQLAGYWSRRIND